MKPNLIFFLARFGFGGAGNSVFRLISKLDKKKYKIYVICLNKCAYENQLKRIGVIIFKVKVKKLIYSIFKIQKIISEISSRNKINFVISNINYTNIFSAIILWKNKNIKLIGFERTPIKELDIYFGIFDFIKKNFLKILLKFSYRRFDRIICNSSYICRQLKDKYGYNSVKINPPSITGNIRIKYNYKTYKEILISTVCRLSKEKKIEEIIYALKILNNKNIKLIIVGTGPEEKKLVQLINKLNLQKQVKFIGFKKNIYNIIKKSNLFLNSSYFEGFPNSVIEAMRIGIPVICSQSHGGINEILSNGKYGTIYANGHINLANEVKNFIKNPTIFFNKAKKAKKYVKKYNLKNHHYQFNKLLRKI